MKLKALLEFWKHGPFYKHKLEIMSGREDSERNRIWVNGERGSHELTVIYGANSSHKEDAALAALLAHAYNMLPKLVEALETIKPECDYESDDELEAAKALRAKVLAEANNVPDSFELPKGYITT